MRIGTLIVVGCLIATSTRVMAQDCKRDMQKIVMAQEAYAQIDPASFRGNNRLFVYLPDIKTPLFGSGWRTFRLSIVEGIYGAPFPRERGSLSEATFESIRTSRNVRVTPVSVPYDQRTRRVARVSQAVTIAGESVRVEIDDVSTGWVGADSVTLRICR